MKNRRSRAHLRENELPGDACHGEIALDSVHNIEKLMQCQVGLNPILQLPILLFAFILGL